jgi:ankyrin repeat protein
MRRGRKRSGAASSAEQRWYALRDAVRRRDYGAAQKMLDDDRTLLTLRNGIGETVLHYLAVENDSVGIVWLHNKGADLDTKNAFGRPVLFEVAQLKYKDLFVWFVDKGADVKAVDRDGQGLVDYLEEFGHSAMAEFVTQFGA